LGKFSLFCFFFLHLKKKKFGYLLTPIGFLEENVRIIVLSILAYSRACLVLKKVRLKKQKKKKPIWQKKLKSAFKGLKHLKITKTDFWQNVKNESFVKKYFLLKSFISQIQFKHTLNGSNLMKLMTNFIVHVVIKVLLSCSC
jgi:hypothetical protein